TTNEVRLLGAAPPRALVEALRTRKVAPLSVGHSILATWEPHEKDVLDAVRELGLDWQIIFNKGAVMCLPAGVTKATGLLTPLAAFDLSPINVLAMGDAENALAFMNACGASAAVANALDALKEQADIVTKGVRGFGVEELIDRVIGGEDVTAGIRRHDIELGRL